MCRPSCCGTPGGQGAGIAAVAIILMTVALAAKIGPIVARIMHLAIEVIRIVTLTAATVVALAVLGWLTVTVVRWQLRHRGTTSGRRRCGRLLPSPGTRSSKQTTGRHAWPAAAAGRVAAGDQRQPVPGPGMPGLRACPAGGVITMPQPSAREPPQQPLHPGPRARSGASQRRRCHLAVPHRTSGPHQRRDRRLGTGPGGHRHLGGGHPHRIHRRGHGAAVDQAVCHPAGLVRPVPSPHPAGLLRDPDAHTVRAAAPGAAHRPDRGRGTRTDLVPRRDLRRRLRSARRPRSPPPAWPARPASRATGAGRSWSPSTSCAATPSPRTTSSHPASLAASARRRAAS